MLSQLPIHLLISLMYRIELLMRFLEPFQLISRVHQYSISLIRVHMDIDRSARHRLHRHLRSISPETSQVYGHIFLSNIKMRHCGEHHRVVVLLLVEFVLESHDFEALAADLATVLGSFSNEVEHLLMGVRVIFYTRSHTDNYSPRTIRGENQDWIIDSSKLRMDCGLHLVPLIQL